ncbi:class I SAM-dependent methyltransferase [Gorillibacterium timonense]|uniref:class I SAM-dependent methyltransferase n=1 Tax=Gorillibacterium timonense TaxID=1689269 RepID=UPI00071D7232|nr:class I SAM-dependent methyltransferase [Gorillibacterium timonense]
MGFVSVLAYAQKLVGERLQPGEIAVDATAGTGVDTLFLAQKSGPRGTVYSFDIQEEALNRTRERLQGQPGLSEVRLIAKSHHVMKEAVEPAHLGKIAAVMFNLGYLPGADSGVITLPETTLPALEAACRLLRRGGVLTAVLYPGHAGGGQEAHAVQDWAEQLPGAEYEALTYRFVNREATAPYLIGVSKRK